MSHDGHDRGSMDGGSMGCMGSSSDRKMMHMSFYWGIDAMVLFSGWPKDSLAMYILALFVVLLMAFVTELLSTVRECIKDSRPVGQAVVYAIHEGLHYMVMLAAMSFNVGIFIAIVVGHAIGSYVFKARDGAPVNQNGANLNPNGATVNQNGAPVNQNGAVRRS